MDAERPHRPGHIRAARLFVRELDHGLARQPCSRLVDGASLILQTEAMQPETVRPEGVGFDDLRARLQILLMHRAHQLRLRQVQLVEALVEKDASPIKRSTHGPVTQDRSIAEKGRQERHLLMLEHFRRDRIESVVPIAVPHGVAKPHAADRIFASRRSRRIAPIRARQHHQTLCYTSVSERNCRFEG